jgi:hypothetical protein
VKIKKGDGMENKLFEKIDKLQKTMFYGLMLIWSSGYLFTIGYSGMFISKVSTLWYEVIAGHISMFFTWPILLGAYLSNQ